MEVIYFCPSTMGFYPGELTGDAVGKDAIEITAEEYAELAGKALMMGADGRPTLYVAPAPTAEELTAAAYAMRDDKLRTATLRIAPLQDAVDLDEASESETALLKLWKKYRVDLNRIQDQAGFPGKIKWPESPNAQ